jgi:hypothetical protein
MDCQTPEMDSSAGVDGYPTRPIRADLLRETLAEWVVV